MAEKHTHLEATYDFSTDYSPLTLDSTNWNNTSNGTKIKAASGKGESLTVGGSTTNVYLGYKSYTPASANHSAEAQVWAAKHYDRYAAPGLSVRDDFVLAGNRYHCMVLWDGSTNYYLRLYVTASGSITEIGTAAVVSSSGKLKLEADGSNIKLYYDGVEKVSATNSQVTAAGKAGMRWRLWDDRPTWTAIGYLDNFKIYTQVAAPTGLSATDGTYQTKIVVTWNAVSGTGITYKVYRNTTNNSATAVLVASGISGTTYTGHPPNAGAGNTYYYWVKATEGGADSEFSSSDSGYRSAPEPCPAEAVTDLGNYLTVTLDAQHNISSGTGDDDNLNRVAHDLGGINVVRTGTLTFEDETDDAPAPLLVIDVWGTLESGES